MPSTHLSLHYHVVFSTKERCNFIDVAWRERLHAYLGGVIRSLDGVPENVGGMSDHVHILIGLRATHRLADVMCELKSASSAWVHDEIRMPIFAWQEGYGAFTVSVSNCEKVSEYIRRQEEHHKKRTFQEEYRELLKRNGVEFDERYLW
jgi:putative transposase